MRYVVEVSSVAEWDLRNIFGYIAFELHSHETAVEQLYRLEKSIISLERMPMRFPVYEKGLWRNRGLRVMPVDNFFVFYIPSEDTATVTVLRIMYARRDIEKLLTEG